MNKKLLSLLILFIGFISYAQDIIITSPNGGEVWPGCTGQLITWTSSGVSNNYNIDYSIDNGTNWTSVTSRSFIK